MDNQQATCEWARLAGLLMGDGFFSMIPYNSAKKSSSGFTAVRPIIALVNQDASLIKIAVDLYDKFGVKYYVENRLAGNFGVKNPITTVTVMRFDSVKTVLANILPWLVGDKEARAELLLRYVSKERRGRRTFDPDDATIIREYLAISPKQRKGKSSRLAEVLRDYEQNAQQRDDIVPVTANPVA